MPQWNFSYSVCGVRIIVQLSHDVPDKAFSKHMMPWNGIISTAMLGNVLGEYYFALRVHVGLCHVFFRNQQSSCESNWMLSLQSGWVNLPLFSNCLEWDTIKHSFSWKICLHLYFHLACTWHVETSPHFTPNCNLTRTNK